MTMKAAHAAAGTLWSIGVIRSDISLRREAPKQGAEGAPDVWLDVNPLVAAGLMGIKAGDELIVITWLHQGKREVLQVHPRSNPNNPLTGVFNTRSPDRPNPLGLHPWQMGVPVAIERDAWIVNVGVAIDELERRQCPRSAQLTKLIGSRIGDDGGECDAERFGGRS